jgi:hypothetical protein
MISVNQNRFARRVVLSQRGRKILLAREAKQFAFRNAMTDVVGWVSEA